jgi:polysaccharide pyruvyl transferase WcaK-like protein
MRALVTGIKPYLARLARYSPDYPAAYFAAFAQIRTKKQVFDATNVIGNTGNYFIGDAAIEAVGRDKATFIDFGVIYKKTEDPAYLAEIHSQFKYVVFVTANLLRSDYDAKAEGELLSRFNLPVVVLGIGCQRTRDLKKPLPDGTRRLLEVLRAREHHIFTRGSESADYLISQGLRQVWPTGCPSMFVRPSNVMQAIQRLKLVDWTAKMRIAFSGYLGREPATVQDVKVFGNRLEGSNYVLQDEHLFYKLEFDAADDDAIYNDMSGELFRVRAFPGSAAIRDVRLRIFFNTHQWRLMMAMHDLNFGRRFHGGTAALQVGIPSLMIAVDDRMREMLNQSELPYIDVSDWNAAKSKKDKIALLRKTMAGFDVDRFCERYLGAAEVFRKRLTSLGLG